VVSLPTVLHAQLTNLYVTLVNYHSQPAFHIFYIPTRNPYITDLPHGLPTLLLASTLPSLCMDGLLFLYNLYSICITNTSFLFTLLHLLDHPTVLILSINSILHGQPTFRIIFILHAPSTLRISAFYMDSLYFTLTLRITAVLYKYPTLLIPSALFPCYMTSLTVQYQIAFKIKSSRAVS